MVRKCLVVSVLVAILVNVTIEAKTVEAPIIISQGSYAPNNVYIVDKFAAPINKEVTQQSNRKEFVPLNIGLENDLQEFIFEYSLSNNISPYLVIAVIERESKYDSTVVGDNGRSFGLMQIQKRWHLERMEILGVTNLLDPKQNVMVGVDYLEELFEENSDIYLTLMKYNMKRKSAIRLWEVGKYSEYAIEVADRARELEEEHEVSMNAR